MIQSTANTPYVPPLDLLPATCPEDLLSLVTAVRESKVHIITKTFGGYHIHFGNKADINTKCSDFSGDKVVFANAGTFNLRDNVFEAKGIKIPTDHKKIAEAIAYMKSTGIM